MNFVLILKGGFLLRNYNMEKKVRICDDCQLAIATSECEICGNDCCEDCHSDNTMSFINNNILDIWIVTCKDCYTHFNKDSIKLPKKIIRELKEKLLHGLKQKMMVKKL